MNILKFVLPFAIGRLKGTIGPIFSESNSEKFSGLEKFRVFNIIPNHSQKLFIIISY